ILLNRCAVPPLCNFIPPAIVRSGPLAIAISTAGASPALAKRMKREIAEAFGEPYARLAVLLNHARGWAKGTLPPYPARKAFVWPHARLAVRVNEARGWAKGPLPTYQDRKVFFEGIVNGEPDPVELLRAGDDGAVRDLIAAAPRTHTPGATAG